jgi:hypothetical protein
LGALDHYQGSSTVEREKRGKGHTEKCKMNAMILRQETQLAITIGKTKSIYKYQVRQSIHIREINQDIQQISDGINPRNNAGEHRNSDETSINQKAV